MLDKSLKVLWLVNGMFFLALLLFVGYQLFLEHRDSYNNDEAGEALVIGGEPAEGLRKGDELQGPVYERIENVPGSPIRILPISAQRSKATSDERNKYSESFLRGEDEVNHISYGNVNLIFMDIDYRVINTLLTKKAFIQTAASPLVESLENTLDPRIRNIIYLISFEDSNNDGLLNESDSSDLYISDVDGSNLVQVTRNVFVQDFKFINNNSEVLISFQKQATAESEYHPTHFAKYQIARETLVEMSDLHQELLKVEKLLQIDSTERKP